MTKQVPHLRWRVLGVLGVLSVWRLPNGRLECPNKRGLCAGKGQAAMLERWPWCSKGWRPEGLVAAAARKPWSSWRIVRLVAGGAVPHLRWRALGVLGVLSVWRLANGRARSPNKRAMCRQRAGCNAGSWRPGAGWKLPRGMCRQKAGCNPGAAKGDGQAWWKLPRRNWRVRGFRGLKPGKRQARMPQRERAMCRQRRVLGVLGVWSLANGRFECPNKRGLCAGKGQAAMLERWRPGAGWKLPRGMCRQRAGCNPGAAKADGQAWWKLPRRNWRVVGVLGVLGVWSLANGRLECPNERGLCAGKGGF